MKAELSNFLTNHARIKNLAEKIFLSITCIYVDLSSNVFYTQVSQKSIDIDCYVLYVYTAVRIGSSLADAAVARIVQGTKVLTLGGSDALFQQSFGVFPGENLIKSFACYLSTSTGPVIGTLYISNLRLAFCSDYPLCHYPFSLQQNHTLHYKVL